MDIQQSMDKILADEDGQFAKQFYATFFEKHPVVVELFRDVGMGQQSVKLTMSLHSIVHYYTNSTAAIAQFLRLLGQKHYQRGIRHEDYPMFEDALLSCLASYHSAEWDDALATEWKAALGNAIDEMRRGHADAE